MKKLKVMSFIIHMGSGGAQELLVNYLRVFKHSKELDFVVVVIEEPRDSKYDRIIRDEQLNVIYLNAPTSLKPRSILQNQLIKLWEAQKVYQTIRKYKPNIVHTHLTQLLRRTLVPIILSGVKIRFHTLHSNPTVYHGLDRITARLAFSIGKFIPVCINEKQQALAREKYGFSENELLYNGIDFDALTAKKAPAAEARELLNLPQDAYIAGAVGRISQVKNYDFMIQVFAEVKKKCSNAVLVIAGSGDREDLQKLIQEKELQEAVIFLGEIRDMAIVYSAFDVFVQTSHYESSSMVTLEAQAMGLACVIADSVPKESVVSKQVVRLSLSEPLAVWRDCILKEPVRAEAEQMREIDDYHIRAVTEKLKEMYLKYAEG